MSFQNQVIKFENIELSKMTHKLDQSILIDIRPLSFKSAQKKSINQIKFNQVNIRGVGELALDKISWEIPEIAKTSSNFKELFVESFISASACKMSALGPYKFYPNFSELAYRLKIKKTAMFNIELTEIDLFAYSKIVGKIPEILNQKCIIEFGDNYGQKLLSSFAEEFPKWNAEINEDFKLKNKRVS